MKPSTPSEIRHESQSSDPFPLLWGKGSDGERRARLRRRDARAPSDAKPTPASPFIGEGWDEPAPSPGAALPAGALPFRKFPAREKFAKIHIWRASKANLVAHSSLFSLKIALPQNSPPPPIDSNPRRRVSLNTSGAAPWCSGSTYCPVKAEIAGSNPVGVATVFRRSSPRSPLR